MVTNIIKRSGFVIIHTMNQNIEHYKVFRDSRERDIELVQVATITHTNKPSLWRVFSKEGKELYAHPLRIEVWEQLPKLFPWEVDNEK